MDFLMYGCEKVDANVIRFQSFYSVNIILIFYALG